MRGKIKEVSKLGSKGEDRVRGRVYEEKDH